MDKNDEKALADIEKYGCHILLVLESEDHSRFAYSIGIEQRTGHPEIIITGLKHDLAHSLINEYNERVKAGEVFESDKYYSGFIENFDVTFKKVEQKHFKDYFGWARWLYKNDEFTVLQLIYPSTSGVWPWDPNAAEDFTFYVPRLYKN